MSIKEYLTFTRRERYGILALIVMLLFVALLPRIIPRQKPKAGTALSAGQFPPEGLHRSPPRLTDHDSLRTGYSRSYDETDRTGTPGDDPADDAGGSWRGRRSGSFSGTVGRYYKNSYGRYPSYDKRDFRQKPWFEDAHRKLFPAGSASGRASFSEYHYRKGYDEGRSDVHGSDPMTAAMPRGRHGRWPYSPVDINTADTSALIALPGIGSKLAARIVSFREKLGGFSSVYQIREVYGLRDSVFLMLAPFLKCDSAYTGKRGLTYNTVK